MKKERIPRPIKACFWALLAIVVAIAYYIALGCPTLSIRQEMRRAERANLVGPSKIVDRVVSPEYSQFETMLVGETDHGIIFFGRYGSHISGNKHSGERNYLFHYIEKNGDVSFAAAPNIYGFAGIYQLPVYLFTELDSAARATISIRVNGSRMYTENNKSVDDPFDVTFEADATRDKKGFFRFDLQAANDHPQDLTGKKNDEAYALFCLSNLCSNNAHYNNQATMVIPIRITLYDSQGNVILTKDLQLVPYETAEPQI